MRSAAWRISMWATLAFAVGTMVAFLFLHRFVAADIQRRSDAWLAGEVEVLGDVAERTPNDALYNRVVGEVAELAAREVPNKQPDQSADNESVFFLQTAADGSMKLWVGAGNGMANLRAIESTRIQQDKPTSIRVPGFGVPFRVASTSMDDHTHIYLGLSERDELRVLRKLRLRFFLLWLALVMMGYGIVFFTTRRMLSLVRRISETASRIDHSDLTRRVPTSERNDEIAQLALTLNGMLDRIENSMHQLHTITESLAHDLRSPLTAIRGKLESSLSGMRDGEHADSVVSAIDELDRLTDFLNKSLDVAEARADALRLSTREIDLSELLRVMTHLYEPSMSDRGLTLRLRSTGPLKIVADEGLIHRMVANLFDNELKHLGPNHSVLVRLEPTETEAVFTLQDNGRGFDPELVSHLLERRVKGPDSTGHGLGLSFVDAVVRAHGGSIAVSNAKGGGALISIALPLAPEGLARTQAPSAAVAE